jgi:hypothetical protein
MEPGALLRIQRKINSKMLWGTLCLGGSHGLVFINSNSVITEHLVPAGILKSSISRNLCCLLFQLNTIVTGAFTMLKGPHQTSRSSLA